MTLSVKDASLFVTNMTTRIPFEYGMTRLTALPHLFVQIDLELDGEHGRGMSADGLAPGWFTKDPDQTYHQEIREMCSVISTAVDRLVRMASCSDPFTCWLQLYEQQMAWGRDQGIPDLLTNFGISLAERALLDAFCRIKGVPFHRAIQEHRLGIQLGEIHEDLSGTAPSDWLDETPRSALRIRHTVGLSDPITSDEAGSRDRPEDGLPLTLEENIDTYNLTHFKIKVNDDRGASKERLRRISELAEEGRSSFVFSLDGNESFDDLDEFRGFWEELVSDDQLRSFLQQGLLFVEQPLRREVLRSEAQENPVEWADRPPMIIDESDANLDSLPRALEQGYHGTSHKNCKGVFKGIANRCLIASKNAEKAGTPYRMSAEDLSTVGPVSLLQDLSVIATLGFHHAERNGHHYFPGLSEMPDQVQQRMLEHHGALYRRHRAGTQTFPSLDITDGQITLEGVNRAPFGYNIDLNPEQFTPLSDWSFESLGIESSG